MSPSKIYARSSSLSNISDITFTQIVISQPDGGMLVIVPRNLTAFHCSRVARSGRTVRLLESLSICIRTSLFKSDAALGFPKLNSEWKKPEADIDLGDLILVTCQSVGNMAFYFCVNCLTLV